MARILIIDDDPWIVELTRAFLEELGHTVAEAADGESGIRRAADGDLEAVLLDMKLPRMTGEEVLQGLRGVCPSLPVLFFTGYPPEMLGSLLKTPRTGYLEKPFTAASITAALASVGVT